MEHVFGRQMICADAQLAHKVALEGDQRQRKLAFTLQGDKYDPQGSISGGTRSLCPFDCAVCYLFITFACLQVHCVRATDSSTAWLMSITRGYSVLTKPIDKLLNLPVHYDTFSANYRALCYDI